MSYLAVPMSMRNCWAEERKMRTSTRLADEHLGGCESWQQKLHMILQNKCKRFRCVAISLTVVLDSVHFFGWLLKKPTFRRLGGPVMKTSSVWGTHQSRHPSVLASPDYETSYSPKRCALSNSQDDGQCLTVELNGVARLLEQNQCHMSLTIDSVKYWLIYEPACSSNF
jgi:hypothetical protein